MKEVLEKIFADYLSEVPIKHRTVLEDINIVYTSIRDFEETNRDLSHEGMKNRLLKEKYERILTMNHDLLTRLNSDMRKLKSGYTKRIKRRADDPVAAVGSSRLPILALPDIDQYIQDIESAFLHHSKDLWESRRALHAANKEFGFGNLLAEPASPWIDGIAFISDDNDVPLAKSLKRFINRVRVVVSTDGGSEKDTGVQNDKEYINNLQETIEDLKDQIAGLQISQEVLEKQKREDEEDWKAKLAKRDEEVQRMKTELESVRAQVQMPRASIVFERSDNVEELRKQIKEVTPPSS